MDENGIDYQKVLADLRTRRDKLNSAIAGIEELLGIAAQDLVTEPPGSGPTEPAATGTRPVPRQVASDTFFQMSAADAARKYLAMVKRPASTNEMCEALTRGGYLTNAKNFYSNLYTTLFRTPGFVKVKKDWGLAEWYPGRRTERSADEKADD